jgi:hypothetical protein
MITEKPPAHTPSRLTRVACSTVSARIALQTNTRRLEITNIAAQQMMIQFGNSAVVAAIPAAGASVNGGYLLPAIAGAKAFLDAPTDATHVAFILGASTGDAFVSESAD